MSRPAAKQEDVTDSLDAHEVYRGAVSVMQLNHTPAGPP
jgi:hypothetical protein